jgi:hypothetical protein
MKETRLCVIREQRLATLLRMIESHTKLKSESGDGGLDSTRAAAQDWRIVQNYLSHRLAEISLPDSDGREMLLGSLWAKQPAVLVFLRHYG